MVNQVRWQPDKPFEQVATDEMSLIFGDDVMSETPNAPRKWFNARTIAKVAVILLFICQFMPFTAGRGFVSHENEDPLTTRGGDDSFGTYHHGYVAEVSSYPGDVGWQAHPYAWIILILFAAYFFTKIHDDPRWSRWGYWVAAVLALGCTGGPFPPVSMMGGFIGAVGLGLMIYTAFLHEQTKSPTVP